VESVVEREEWVILLTMVADIRAELRGIHELLRGDEGEAETEEDA
jgi:hypothetical protein